MKKIKISIAILACILFQNVFAGDITQAQCENESKMFMNAFSIKAGTPKDYAQREVKNQCLSFIPEMVNEVKRLEAERRKSLALQTVPFQLRTKVETSKALNWFVDNVY